MVQLSKEGTVTEENRKLNKVYRMEYMKDLQSDACVLADFIRNLNGFRMIEIVDPDYDHMGAMLADAVLQSGLNYQTVVSPRVQHILKTYPKATTLPLFQDIIEEHGAKHILQWNDCKKPSLLLRLMDFLAEQRISTIGDLNSWLRHSDSGAILQEIKGIGPKTADYLAILAGIDIVAVDIHLKSFVHLAGIKQNDYESIKNVISCAADLLKVTRRTLDRSIWTYQSTKP